MSGWFFCAAAVVALIMVRWELRHERDERRQLQIRMEEAQAWADEYERERDALAAECDRLREERATLQGMYVRRTRESLAANFWIIASNVEHRRRMG